MYDVKHLKYRVVGNEVWVPCQKKVNHKHYADDSGSGLAFDSVSHGRYIGLDGKLDVLTPVEEKDTVSYYLLNDCEYILYVNYWYNFQKEIVVKSASIYSVSSISESAKEGTVSLLEISSEDLLLLANVVTKSLKALDLM